MPDSSLLKKIDTLPLQPGVYLYKDAKGTIIYVGKAIRLRQRVKSYFRDDPRATVKTKVLVKNIADLEFLVVNNEVEALVLENNLIKKHRPRYNIRMRDDKNYSYIKITNEAFPQVIRVRKMKKDGAKYYGPYTDGGAIKQTLQALQKIFPYRKCRHTFFSGNTLEERNPKHIRPCIEYQMGRCIGICDPKLANRTEHHEIIDQVKRFFEGRSDELKLEMVDKMMAAAQAKEFERAARLRDQMKMMEHVLEKQQAVSTDLADRDVFGIAIHGDKACVQLLKIRQGHLIGRETMSFDSGLEVDEAEVMSRAITEYYDRAQEIPREILLPVSLESLNAFSDWLKQQREDLLGRASALELSYPQRGDKKRIVDLANENAKEQLEELLSQWLSKKQRISVALREIKEALQLPRRPERIECYDISHFGGTGTVASMVVFEEGESKKSDYRRFKLKAVSGGDDYGAMEEILQRRFRYAQGTAIGVYGLKVRKAGQRDILQTTNIINEQQLDSIDLDPEQLIMLKKDKDLIGLARLRFLASETDASTPAEEAKIHTIISSLWVEPKWRGNKLGYVLISDLIKRSKDKVLYVVIPQDLEGYFAGFGWQRLLQIPARLQQEQQQLLDSIVLRFDKKGKKTEDLSFSMVPDLLVVDGGKGQLASALKVMERMGLKRPVKAGKGKKLSPWAGLAFPVVGLAKQEEEVWFSITDEQGKTRFDKIDLPNDTQGSLLLQAARDEAHRFANTYQKKVRHEKWLEH